MEKRRGIARECGYLLLWLFVGFVVAALVDSFHRSDLLFFIIWFSPYALWQAVRRRSNIRRLADSARAKPYAGRVLLCSALLLFVFVWPGIWRYEYDGGVQKSYEFGAKVRRYDRLTQRVQEWIEAGDRYYGERVTESHWHKGPSCDLCKGSEPDWDALARKIKKEERSLLGRAKRVVVNVCRKET